MIRKGRSRPGLSLIDLSIALLIISIAVSAAVPRVARTLSRYRIEAAAHRIAADLALARRHAKLTSETKSVRFNVVNDTYTCTGIPDPLRNNKTYVVDLTVSPYSVDIVSAGFNGDTELEFNGFGIPDSGGSVVVRSGDYTRTVVVDAESGEALTK